MNDRALHIGNSEHDPWAQLRRAQKLIAGLPEPIAYIVLDHSWDPRLPHVDGHDLKGRRYVLCSVAVLDEAKHIKPGEEAAPTPGVLSPALTGIPLYRREDMPEGWPDV